MRLRNAHDWPVRGARRPAAARCPVTFRLRHATLLAARRSPRCRDAARRLFLS
ncbi:hypothetical protein [Actinoplanes solisilvae]|uniref:hypothetical protein n=1 Tax=Actinoplanes solisilvae TaxID=2486853 RepID=UPI0013E346D2|nr:hypothetical protein [Actinoplanes solisilvae]